MIDYTGQKLGNYRLVKLLGQGGFADVYLGEHIYLQTAAAIKVVQAQLTDEALEKFLVEARTIARLTHPNIVPVLEFGIEQATPFLVMSYASYGSLRQRHPRGSILAPLTIVSYVEQIATALQYAHDRHVIHCDVKPENMLLGQHETLMLSDFGIAISAQSIDGMSSPAAIVGTATYMAPEQFYGKPSTASDQYALGIVVYEWLGGAPPFNGNSMEIATQHMQVPPAPLREKLPTLAPAIEHVIMQAIAKDPQERYACVRDFARALKAACATTPSLLAGPRIISLPSSPQARPGTSLRLSSSDFPVDGYISRTVAIPFTASPTPQSPAASSNHLAQPLQHYWPPLSRRTVIGGLFGLTAVGVLATLGAEMLWRSPAEFKAISARKQREIPTPTATPNISATAQAIINAAATRPAVTSSGPNTLDLFIRGGDNALWHKHYDGSWHDWEALGNLATDPAAVSLAPGRFDLFTRGTDNTLQHKWFDGTWHDWESLGGTLTADPAVTSSSAGRLDLLARSVANGIWYNYFDGAWHDWQALGGVSVSAPCVTSSYPGRIDGFVLGTDNALWYRWFDGTWHDWASLGGAFTSDPAVTSWGPGRFDVFVRGGDYTLQHIWYDGTWHSWESLGGALSSSPAAVSWGSNRIDVFARDMNNILQHKWYEGAWSDWQAFI
ncbi:MAG: protein kinase domain-containing protein [Ktedonobacteraceae bacterium]